MREVTREQIDAVLREFGTAVCAVGLDCPQSACRREVAMARKILALEAERDEAWKAHHAVREGWAQLHANMRQCESLLDESEAERDALAARVEELMALVREVGASGVEHHTRNYVVAQIDPDTFEACRALAAAPTPTTPTETTDA